MPAIAGTIKDYQLVDNHGDLVTGAQLNYNGQPAGYTLNPPDVINYISAHDNQTLLNNNQYKINVGPESTACVNCHGAL